MKGDIPYDGISGIKAPDGQIYHTQEHRLPKMIIDGLITFEDAFGNDRETALFLGSMDLTDFRAYTLLGGTDRFLEETLQALHRAEALKPTDYNQPPKA